MMTLMPMFALCAVTREEIGSFLGTVILTLLSTLFALIVLCAIIAVLWIFGKWLIGDVRKHMEPSGNDRS